MGGIPHTVCNIKHGEIERLNGTFREHLACLSRRCRHAARQTTTLSAGMWLVGTIYNFCFWRVWRLGGSVRMLTRNVKCTQMNSGSCFLKLRVLPFSHYDKQKCTTQNSHNLLSYHVWVCAANTRRFGIRVAGTHSLQAITHKVNPLGLAFFDCFLRVRRTELYRSVGYSKRTITHEVSVCTSN